MTGILRCPFCGSQSMLDNWNGKTGDKMFFVRCYVSRCNVAGPERATEDEAIAAWNTRHWIEGQVMPKQFVEDKDE